ncbi:hypothetical protein [Polynucleobacter rarus]|uniref:hypothetical protein n=1 Tax=Polynucleobacter rarus TaxID=556055 RepID=UPI000D3E573F|nr:hypothetical protein [Polynucleobacter rarus]
MKITAQLKELIELDCRLKDKSLTQSELDDLIKRWDEICDSVRAIKAPVWAEREYLLSALDQGGAVYTFY